MNSFCTFSLCWISSGDKPATFTGSGLPEKIEAESRPFDIGEIRWREAGLEGCIIIGFYFPFAAVPRFFFASFSGFVPNPDDFLY